MQIDDNIKNSLLSLDNKALKKVVSSLADAAGVNTSKINISDSDLMKLRSVIRDASDKDAEEAIRLIGGSDNAHKIIDDARKRGGGNE